ncbi:MAG: hypothetical protein MJ175_11575, partial [Clostridia bacterium]|nr:hypothetical protein [Clostridia bacterium]
MKHSISNLYKNTLFFLVLFCLVIACVPVVRAVDSPLITTVEDLTGALMNAGDGDTILVGDIAFKPMPMGMIVVPKNVTIRSGLETNAVFTNATFALNGSTSDSEPLKVQFENIDFRGDLAGVPIDPENAPNISSGMPDIMKTMCAAIFKMNVDVSYTGCTFEGYHYGYGGVFNAIYSSEDNKNTLKLNLEDCIFQNNASRYGGSLYLIGYNHNITLHAKHCAFDHNAAATGGALWAQDADIRLLDCSFVGDQYLPEAAAAPDGGAMALYNCSTELDACLIADNTAGSHGAGIFAEIQPFRTLIMENCTVFGNTAENDDCISVVPGKTNLDTPAMAHIYFSTLVGRQDLAEHVEQFGCLLIGSGDNMEPGRENGFCLSVSSEDARNNGLIPASPAHIVWYQNEYPIPEEEVSAVAAGKFADSLGQLYVGDNYIEEVTIALEQKPGETENITLRYKDKLSLVQPERSGYSFVRWEFYDGTAFTDSMIFMGGVLPSQSITARWHYLLSEHLYVIWVPLFLLAAAGVIWILGRRRKVVPEIPQTE